MLKYIALFEQDKDADLVGVVFPDLPGCFSSGKDYEDAFKNAHEALSLYADEVKNLPKPRTLEEIKKSWEDWDEWKNYNYTASYISLLPASATKKYTISMDAALMAQIDAVSKNRSSFLAAAVRRYLSLL